MENVFETGRLLVRRFRLEDAERLYEIHLDDEVKKWIPNESYEDPEEAREAISFLTTAQPAGSFVSAINRS